MKAFIKKCFVAAIVFILCEILIFNFASVISLGNNEEIKFNFYNAKSTELINAEYLEESKKLYIAPNESACIIFNNIDAEINTLYVDAMLVSEELEIKFSYDEDTNSQSLRSNGRINIIKDNEHSKYALCSFSGNIKTLKIYLQTGENEDIFVSSIIANKKVPFQFSFVRLLTLLSVTILIIAMSSLECFKCPVSNNHAFKNITQATTAVFLLIVFLLSCFASDGISNDFKHPSLNQINQELVDAFEAGQVHLLREPEEELLALENPYDWSQRLQSNVTYAWDHCLYNGQYYSYYGIAPVLLLFLPYHLITGMYFPSVWAIFIFGFLGVLFLGMTYYLFIKKFFPKIPVNIATCGLVITMLICGIWYCMPVPNFYEIAQSSGFAFTTMGAYFMLSSNAVSEGRISNLKAALSSVFLALSVLCRPTLALYCIVALVFIFFGAKKAFTGKNVKKLTVYLLASLIPFVIIGSVQMIYNYLRFDSFFDFGIQYSLTINDFTQTDYHTPLALIGFYNFLFAFPKVMPEFPFIDSNYSTLGVNGYYFTANTAAIGIIFRALPVFSYLYAGKAYKLSKSNKKAAVLILATCVAAPLIIIFSIWESGYGVRYCADFYWQILLGALTIAFFLYPKLSTPVKKICEKLMIISLMVALITTFAQIYSYIYSPASTELKTAMLSFGRLFEFWNLM